MSNPMFTLVFEGSVRRIQKNPHLMDTPFGRAVVVHDGDACEALDEAEDRAEALEDALDGVMVGGNHLASLLINRLGAGFSERYPPHMDHEAALHSLGATDEYDVWCCWAAIMRARDVLQSSTVEPDASRNHRTNT